MLQKNTAENIARWTEIVRSCNMECSAQGISKEEWLKNHQVQEKHFYYWQTMLRQMDQDMALGVEAPVFAKIAESRAEKADGESKPATSEPSYLAVNIGAVYVEVSGCASPETLDFLKWVVLNA